MDIKSVVVEFANRISALIENEATERARSTVLAAFGAPPRRGPGRPAKAASAITPVAIKSRRKGPIQLCPVPGCKNPAAPIFGMVCAKHKDVKKRLIKKYREARKAQKAGGEVVAKKGPKRRTKPLPKKARKRKAKEVVATKPVPSTTAAAAS